MLCWRDHRGRRPNAFDGYAVDWAAWVDASLLTPAEEPVDAPEETEAPVDAPVEGEATPRIYLPVVVK